jgi:hypothetical protein
MSFIFSLVVASNVSCRKILIVHTVKASRYSNSSSCVHEKYKQYLSAVYMIHAKRKSIKLGMAEL